jgi:DNA invertase Pin-like site-specific DNA recombinase
MTTKAFGYTRVSSIGQVAGDGFPRQQTAIHEWANKNSFDVVEIFQENGVSGTIEDRPALARLMVSLEENGHGIKTVIIERLDRLARDLMVQEAIVRDLKLHGFNLISTLEGPDLCADEPTRKLIRQVIGAIAEYDKSMIVAKLKASRLRMKARTGKCEGRKGYRDTDDGIVILRTIQALRTPAKNSKPRTYQQIAHILNSEQLLTLDGKLWSLYRVQQVLKG